MKQRGNVISALAEFTMQDALHALVRQCSNRYSERKNNNREKNNTMMKISRGRGRCKFRGIGVAAGRAIQMNL